MYKNYEIKAPFIYLNGKEVFINTWRQDRSEAACKNLIDAEKAFAPLPDKQAALTRMIDGPCELENNSQAIADFTDRVNSFFEIQMFENERD